MKTHINFPLQNILYYHIGGNAAHLLEIGSEKDISEALEYLAKNRIQKIIPIGLGANLLMNDTGFDGAILYFKNPHAQSITHDENGMITVFASHTLDDVIQYSFAKSMKGLEWAGGLPSTVGASVRGNVGCFGSEIKDVCVSAEVFDLQNPQAGKKTFSNHELQFAYRTSFIKQHRNLLISSCTLQFQSTDEEGIKKAKDVYLGNINYRKTHHPVEYPSCGSVFKNIVKKEEVEKITKVWSDIQSLVEQKWHHKVAMGYVINRLGFIGLQIGQAQVSEKHSNYIINKGGAKFTDVYSIIQKIQQRFYKTFGFPPELEVEIIQ